MRKACLLFTVLMTGINCSGQTADEYFDRGMGKYKLNDKSGAILDFSKTIEINPKDADAYFYRGLAKGELEDYKNAIPDYNNAI